MVRAYLSQFALYYPDIDRWYVEKVIPGVVEGTRSILTSRDAWGAILGLAITRNGEQAKLCHFSIAEEARGTGVGRKLLQEATEAMISGGARNIRLTMGEEVASNYKDFFIHYGFEEDGHEASRYRRGVDELIWRVDPEILRSRFR